VNTGWPAFASSVISVAKPARAASFCLDVEEGRGRRRKRPGPELLAGHRQDALACLPVDSAISCSTQRPKLPMGSAHRERELVATL